MTVATATTGLFEVQGDFQTTTVSLLAIPNPTTDPAYIAVSLEVVNRSSSQPVAFTFLTTQEYEIEIVDANGQVQSKWSQGRAFGNVVTTKELAPHSSWSYADKVSLVGPNGQWLPSGQYTVRVYLTADKRPGVQSPLSFQLGVA
jgi:Intracellular proteinase inhibitor